MATGDDGAWCSGGEDCAGEPPTPITAAPDGTDATDATGGPADAPLDALIAEATEAIGAMLMRLSPRVDTLGAAVAEARASATAEEIPLYDTLARLVSVLRLEVDFNLPAHD